MGNCPPWNPETVQKIMEMFWGKYQQESPDHRRETKKIRGTVVLMKKNILDLSDLGSSFLDRVHELMGRGVSLQLISSVHVDPGQFLFNCTNFKFFLFFTSVLQVQIYNSRNLSISTWEIIAVRPSQCSTTDHNQCRNILSTPKFFQ